MKRYGYPLIVLTLGSLLLYVVDAYLAFDGKSDFYLLCQNVFLFVFGIYLSQKKTSKGWLKKVLIIVLALLLIFIQMDIVPIPLLSDLLNTIRARSLIYDLIYIYLGYIFF